MDNRITESADSQLGQTLKSRHVAMIAIGGIIGAGLFVGSSTSIATVGPAVILSYGLAGLIILCVMRMLSEMAVTLPGIKSFPEFTRAGLGNWAGFVCGWLYWYFWVVVVAIEAIAGGVILNIWVPLPVWTLGIGLMAVLTFVNLMSAKAYGEFEFWFSSLKVAAILTFIAIAASKVLGIANPSPAGFANLTAHGGFMPFGAGAVLAGTTSVIFSLVGAEIATIAAAESAEPTKTVARMTSTVAIRILIFYVLSISLIVCVVPWTEIRPAISPFATALDRMNIPGAATIMNAIVLVAVLSCLNSGLYVTSRVLFTLASHRDAPQALIKVNARKVPARAILVASIFSYGALVASILSPQLVFSFLVNASGALMILVYMMIAIAHIRIRWRLQREGHEMPSIRMWAFPWLSFATLAAMALILLAMGQSAELASQLFASLAISALCFGIYWIFRRGKAVEGPAPISEGEMQSEGA